MRLSPADFQALFEQFHSTALRVETLPRYRVVDEEPELTRFLSGEPLPDLTTMQDWLDGIRAATRGGRCFERIRLLPQPINSYFAFELEWGYLYSAEAGEVIRFLTPEHAAYDAVSRRGDFWLFDDRVFVAMDYASDGSYEGADRFEQVPDLGFELDDLRSQGVGLTDYLAQRRSKPR